MKNRILILMASALLLTGAQAHATNAENFAGLLTELQTRSQVLSNFLLQAGLSNSVRKVAVTQNKACLLSIQSIRKADLITNDTALTKGIMTVGQVATTLRKPFAPELLNSNVFFQVGNYTSTHNLQVLLTATSTAFADAVADQLAAVDLTGLPAGLQAKIQASITAANALLAQAGLQTDFAKITKFISNALKAAANALKAAAAGLKQINGGGGGHGLNCKINNAAFGALGATGLYVSQTGELAIAGATVQKSVTLIAVGVTQPGDYPLSSGTFVLDLHAVKQFAGNLSGTIHVTAINPAQHTVSGTFTFTASQTAPTADAGNTVTVTQGTFNISNLTAY